MNKVDILRNYMNERNISAVVIPTADVHLSEYISDYYKLRQYISGFTGSAGTLVVTQNEAGLWTDGRYYIQAEKELSGSGITLYKASEKNCIKIYEFLKEHLSTEDTVGVDGRLFSKKYLEEFMMKLGDIKVNTSFDSAQIWEDRPLEFIGKAFVLDEKYAGISCEEKLLKVRKAMKEKTVTHYLLSTPDCIMWLLNLRGSDVSYTPVMLSYLLVSPKTVTLYVNKNKLTENVSEYLKAHNIEVADYSDIYLSIKQLDEMSCLGADFSMTNYSLLSDTVCAVKNISDFVYNEKCVKTDAEIENIKKAYLKENIALTKAFYEIYHSEDIDECDVSNIIEKYRQMEDVYISPSFDTIAAFGANAAMMHYGPQKETCAKIEGDGFLLIDTGGQYYEGTTDTTRTLAIGNVSKEQTENFTLVLKGNISLATAVFPEETRCCEIDALARIPLWKKGLDYRCSTGHGVGYLLSVHEGPQRLSASCNEKLKVNMTITDEPGVYMEGEYGIRTENHLCVKESFESEYGKYLCFEVLNFCPIGTECVRPELLSGEEINWLNSYNQRCRELIAPHLTKEEAEWLTAYTKEV